MNSGCSLLVLGLGNVLCTDDGLGVRVLSRLERGYLAPPGVRLMDGGTLGLSLLSALENAANVILIDAIQTGEPPGSLVRLEGSDVVSAARERLSPHQVGVADLMDAMRLRQSTPPHMILLGTVPESIELGVGCSPAVHAALPDLIEQVISEAASMGFNFAVRRSRDEVPSLAIGPAADVLGL
jgi:hydrogenase maturation protease